MKIVKHVFVNEVIRFNVTLEMTAILGDSIFVIKVTILTYAFGDSMWVQVICMPADP